ncbi:MAG: cupredoxin domain-containing protein [Myxococcaceae bacterium]|nr:cupredoxin domain-containing protein [Myxococcaceae bacterium]
MRTLSLVVIATLFVTACKKEEVKAVEAAKPAVAAPAPAEVKPAPAPAGAARVVELKVTENGFEPGNVKLKKDEPVKFVVTRVTDATCATELLIAETDIKAELPLNKPVEVAWTPTKAGQVKFGCAMDMMVGGLLLVE